MTNTKITDWHVDPTLPRRYMTTPLPLKMVQNILLRDELCKYHHTSYARGYVTRQRCTANDGTESGYCYVELYKGKFGKGWKIHHATKDSSRYHWVSYWTYPEAKKGDNHGESQN